ncbi:MAG: NAD(P)H-hydrate dehydratase, partial [Lentisphaerae bacterium]
LNRIFEATGFPACTDANRIDSARAISREFGVITVLKGPHTVVCSENGDEIRINPTGSPALASGGSGDVLTGIIAALLPQLPSPLDAAAAGVYIHGLCAEVTGEKARRSIHADDLYQNLGMTLKKLSPFA